MDSTTPQSNLPVPRPPTRAGGRYPFVPYGLVPAVGLLILMLVALIPFAVGEVQAVNQASANAALKRIGADTWASASASGQWISLKGVPPTPAAAAAAEKAILEAQADTLFGKAAPTTWVITHFTWTEDPLVPGRNTPRLGEPGIPAAPPPSDFEIAACDSAMATLLSHTRIEFPTASAAIGPASNGLLDSIAIAARQCQGALRIEGHTDSEGADTRNTALSRRRAEAVRAALIERGVSAERLSAIGYGEGKPISENDTADGRARNRRIEIRSVRSPPT